MDTKLVIVDKASNMAFEFDLQNVNVQANANAKITVIRNYQQTNEHRFPPMLKGIPINYNGDLTTPESILKVLNENPTANNIISNLLSESVREYNVEGMEIIGDKAITTAVKAAAKQSAE